MLGNKKYLKSALNYQTVLPYTWGKPGKELSSFQLPEATPGLGESFP